MPKELSLAVLGALHPNADGTNRQFEIRMLNPGDEVSLVLEPSNKIDSSAVAVFSFRGLQIGYLSAERCGWIGAKIKQGQDVRAVFQVATKDGAIIRVHLDGGTPTLPPPLPEPTATEDELHPSRADPGSGFWPDYIPPDD
ncbi:HIRAN domain-containing protein [Novosphingobium sp. Chol11]|uniref:HIRAN domain-containing protein n=1 Tax=Novosphingobium sp. Chol11 TaxID=1385763 RepID=UPI000BE337B2|nr:HIRAN domain-containing protein [Novosphingobium sp. Chol11]